MKIGRVEQIGANAFKVCAKLKTVDLPLTLKSIGQGSFISIAVDPLNISSKVNIIGFFLKRMGSCIGKFSDTPTTDSLTEDDVLFV